MVTPFQDNGAIDFPALDALVDYVTAGGVDYLVALGTTAETPTLSTAERKAVLERIKSRNAGRLSLVAGIGGNDTLPSWPLCMISTSQGWTRYSV